jgi:DNA-binding transcriptional ArsR family regulator
MSAAFSLLAQPARVEILRLVWSKERSAGDIASQFHTTFGAVSQHIGSLWRAGFLRRRRQGKQLFYVADRAAIGPLAAALEAMWRDQLGVLKTMAEAEQQRIDNKKKPGRAASSPRSRSRNNTKTTRRKS